MRYWSFDGAKTLLGVFVIPYFHNLSINILVLVYELHEEDALRKIRNQLEEIPKTSVNLLKYLR